MIGKEIDELSKRKETLTITISFRLGNISGGGVFPYISYIGMCRPKGYGF